MPIEFNCVRCRARLQIPEEVIGQKTQCPYCQEIQIVAPVAQDGPAFAEPNAAGQGVLTPSRVQFFALLQDTWAIFCARFVEFLILGLILFGIGFVINIPAQIFGQLIGHLDQFPKEANIVIILGYVVLLLFAIICQTALAVGGTRYALHLVRGGPQQLSRMIPRAGQVFKYLLQYLIIILLWFLCMIPGFALIACAIFLQIDAPNAPGIILVVIGILYLWFFSLFFFSKVFLGVVFLVDRNEGPIRSLLSSYAFSTGNTWVLIGTLFVLGTGGTCFACCTCGLGSILVTPFWYCYWAVAYLSITGQPFPRPVPTGPPMPMQPPAPFAQPDLPPAPSPDPPPVENDDWPQSDPAKNE